MADLKAETKRAFLQSLYDAVEGETAKLDLASGAQAADAPIATLLEALKAFQRTGFNALKGGRLSLGTAGLGHEVKWAPPYQWQAFGQEAIFGMQQEFREIYNEAVVTLSVQGNTEPSDLEILNVMMASDRLTTVNSLQRDMTMLRWGGRY